MSARQTCRWVAIRSTVAELAEILMVGAIGCPEGLHDPVTKQMTLGDRCCRKQAQCHIFHRKISFFAETRSPASPRGLPVVATASPVASAAEQQQQEHGDNQEHVHRIPPIRMRRGGVALPIASAILYASLQIQLLAEFMTNAPNAKKFQN